MLIGYEGEILCPDLCPRLRIGESSVQGYAELSGFDTKEQEFSIDLVMKLTTCFPIVEKKAC